MEKWIDLTTEEDIEEALRQAANEPEPVMALSADYLDAGDLIVLKLDNGRRLAIPREDLQGLDHATTQQIAHIEIFGGLDIAWPDLDLDHYLPSLMEGIYGSEKWMHRLKENQTSSHRR